MFSGQFEENSISGLFPGIKGEWWRNNRTHFDRIVAVNLNLKKMFCIATKLNFSTYSINLFWTSLCLILWRLQTVAVLFLECIHKSLFYYESERIDKFFCGYLKAIFARHNLVFQTTVFLISEMSRVVLHCVGFRNRQL